MAASQDIQVPTREQLDFGESAAEVIHIRLDQITSMSQGLLDLSDPEPAAGMYLATRRMRVALELYKPVFPRQQYRSGKEETLLVSRAVAQRYRLDLAIATISAVTEEMHEGDAAGVDGLLADFARERTRANRELGRVVHGRRMQAYRVRMEDLAVSAAGPEFVIPEQYQPLKSVPSRARKRIQRRLDRLRSFAPGAMEPEGISAQRRMGIAAEKLRYLLELTAEGLGSQAHTARRAARGLQAVLGDVSNCETVSLKVRERLARLESEDTREIAARARGARHLDPVLVQAAPNRNAYRGLEMLAIHLGARHLIDFENFSRLWKEQARQGVWAALESSLRNDR